MAEKNNPFHRIRLVYRRSSTLLKCVVLSAIVVCIAALLILRGAILDTKKKQAELKNDAAVLEQENEEISNDISQIGTIESIKKLAGKLLGLVDPDTVIFLPEE